MLITTLTMLRTTLPRKAGQNPSTLSPKPNDCPMELVSMSMIVLMSRLKKPRVRMMSGQVRRLKQRA